MEMMLFLLAFAMAFPAGAAAVHLLASPGQVTLPQDRCDKRRNR